MKSKRLGKAKSQKDTMDTVVLVGSSVVDGKRRGNNSIDNNELLLGNDGVDTSLDNFGGSFNASRSIDGHDAAVNGDGGSSSELHGSSAVSRGIMATSKALG